MSGLIDRQAAIEHFCNKECGMNPSECEMYPCYQIESIQEVPSAEPERKKGKWTATYSDCGGDVWVLWKCSNCGYVRKKGWKYTDDGKKPDALFCEMCNTDMRGEQDDTD